MNINAATNVGGAGLVHTLIIKSLKAGKKTQEAEEAKIEKETEELVKAVPAIYKADRKIIEYDNHGRHLDTFA